MFTENLNKRTRKTGSDRKILFTDRELQVVDALKTREIGEVATALKLRPSTVRAHLNHIRDKIEVARDTSNLAANWLDSSKAPRLAKLLRRQD